ncbi:hypothetical protein NQ317_013157 [Molorchus minor]|uniref:Uncharacterized protein n=1 Tax=Molorchus minor TaxID=1323400 RepID=A0ABQ9JZK6_9CUCU|nr:hypothetical protein NQ317_013157 [Molorchus minor]
MSRTNNTVDLVAQNEILKAQEILEEKAAREWMSKWGFYLDFDKICIIEAQKMGYSKEDYIRMKMKRKTEKYDEDFIWEPVPSKNVPNTTTEYKLSIDLRNIICLTLICLQCLSNS